MTNRLELALRFPVPSHYTLHQLHIEAYCSWYSKAITNLRTDQARHYFILLTVGESVFQYDIAVSLYSCREREMTTSIKEDWQFSFKPYQKAC